MLGGFITAGGAVLLRHPVTRVRVIVTSQGMAAVMTAIEAARETWYAAPTIASSLAPTTTRWTTAARGPRSQLACPWSLLQVTKRLSRQVSRPPKSNSEHFEI